MKNYKKAMKGYKDYERVVRRLPKFVLRIAFPWFEILKKTFLCNIENTKKNGKVLKQFRRKRFGFKYFPTLKKKEDSERDSI